MRFDEINNIYSNLEKIVNKNEYIIKEKYFDDYYSSSKNFYSKKLDWYDFDESPLTSRPKKKIPEKTPEEIAEEECKAEAIRKAAEAKRKEEERKKAEAEAKRREEEERLRREEEERRKKEESEFQEALADSACVPTRKFE